MTFDDEKRSGMNEYVDEGNLWGFICVTKIQQECSTWWNRGINMMERDISSHSRHSLTKLIFPNALFSKIKLIIIHSDTNWRLLGVMYQKGSSTHSKWEWIRGISMYIHAKWCFTFFHFKLFLDYHFPWKLIPHISLQCSHNSHIQFQFRHDIITFLISLSMHNFDEM